MAPADFETLQITQSPGNYNLKVLDLMLNVILTSIHSSTTK